MKGLTIEMKIRANISVLAERCDNYSESESFIVNIKSIEKYTFLVLNISVECPEKIDRVNKK